MQVSAGGGHYPSEDVHRAAVACADVCDVKAPEPDTRVYASHQPALAGAYLIGVREDVRKVVMQVQRRYPFTTAKLVGVETTDKALVEQYIQQLMEA
jgi:hypothetical protein